MAQSGLSASIRSLERELGASLFRRNTRQVQLTAAGQALLAEARRALAATDAARDAVVAVQGLLQGSLAIGTLQCPARRAPAEPARGLPRHPPGPGDPAAARRFRRRHALNASLGTLNVLGASFRACGRDWWG
ncbi:LysR family transcriptional regulator [Actinophytocola sp.]|uniref:LysR family transcriptional regulator n=1 Tax=Actinophytocola sp. TaxID=1872138 RepID=UPI0025C63879|nr:LysR family transcriptional regulator [Actinophytocola sp.]